MAEFYTGMSVFGLNDLNGNPVLGTPGTAAPASAIQIAGSDGTNLRTILTDATGAVVITGTISASNPSVSATAAAVPADATYIGGNKAGNLVGLLLDASGNLQVAVENTVATTVSGTVAVTQSTSPWVVSNGGTFAVQVSAPLPAGTNVIGHVITDTGSTTVVTGTVAVTQSGSWSVSVTGTSVFAGNLTNNNAAPSTTNVGVLPAVVASAPVAWTAGNQSLVTVTPGGSLRTLSAVEANAASITYVSYDSGAAFTAVNAANTPLWSIRANSASVRFLLRELQWITDGSLTYFTLVKNGTLTGGTFAATSPSANVLVDTAATVITAGTIVMSGYVGAGMRSYDDLLTAMASGTPGDTFTMVASPLGTKSNAAAQIRWSETTAVL